MGKWWCPYGGAPLPLVTTRAGAGVVPRLTSDICVLLPCPPTPHPLIFLPQNQPTADPHLRCFDMTNQTHIYKLGPSEVFTFAPITSTMSQALLLDCFGCDQRAISFQNLCIFCRLALTHIYIFAQVRGVLKIKIKNPFLWNISKGVMSRTIKNFLSRNHGELFGIWNLKLPN